MFSSVNPVSINFVASAGQGLAFTSGTGVQSGSALVGLQLLPKGIEVSRYVFKLGVVKFAGYEAHAKPSCSLPFQILCPGFECGEFGEESNPSSSQGFFTVRRGGSTAGSCKLTGIPHRHRRMPVWDISKGRIEWRSASCMCYDVDERG